MMTVVILGILATVAVFSYKRYASQARTQEAIAFLLEIKLKQETYYTTYGQYASVAPPVAWYPPGDPTNSAEIPWEMDCVGGSGEDLAWCSLGVRPSFNACTDASAERCSYHQFYTDGWQPGAADPDANYIKQPSRPWWYALARGDVDSDGAFSEWLLSSELSEPRNRQETEL
jgi:type II secretory pathway pseudopilin PulG